MRDMRIGRERRVAQGHVIGVGSERIVDVRETHFDKSVGTVFDDDASGAAAAFEIEFLSGVSQRDRNFSERCGIFQRNELAVPR